MQNQARVDNEESARAWLGWGRRGAFERQGRPGLGRCGREVRDCIDPRSGARRRCRDQPLLNMSPDRPSKPRLVLFAFGDFAFNLFWQSIMLFLLFYYTDALSLPIGVAATTYLVASVWDGIANFIAGILIDRQHDRFRFGTLL